MRFRLCGAPHPGSRTSGRACRTHIIGFRRVSASCLTERVRATASLARKSMGSILRSLDRFVKRQLQRKRDIRLSNVNCFRVGLGDRRPVASPGLGTGRVGLGTGVDFGTSVGLGGSMDIMRLRQDGIGQRSTSHAGRRISGLLAGCFDGGSVLAHPSFRKLYGFATAATTQRVEQLGRRGGLRGVGACCGPVCTPVPKCCNETGL